MRQTVFDLPAGRFHALEGDGARPLVFLHGFPDHPPTARTFFAELAARGHRVLAPWLRGYAPSPRKGPFDVPTLAGDIRALIDRWSPGHPVDVVGHDWGAVITYALCVLAPDRVRRAVTLAVPHPLTFVRQLRKPAQLRASWYMGVFQLPGSEWLVRRGDLALVDRLWRAWSPGLTLPATDRAQLHACLRDSLPAPLAYYRIRPGALREQLALARTPIATPLLALHGERDGCILPPREADAHRFTGLYERGTFGGLGHFLHLEDPHAVAARVSAWLG